MEHSYLHTLDYHSSFLSAFDISGSLLLGNNVLPPKGLEYDTSQLMKDHQTLEKDYKKAYERILRDEGNKE